MFAVIQTGGKQYKVASGDRIEVETLSGAPGDTVTFDTVLMVGDGAETKLAPEALSGTVVEGEIVDHVRGRKIIVFKKRRRKNSRTRNGHRQNLTVVRITDIRAA